MNSTVMDVKEVAKEVGRYIYIYIYYCSCRVRYRNGVLYEKEIERRVVNEEEEEEVVSGRRRGCSG